MLVTPILTIMYPSPLIAPPSPSLPYQKHTLASQLLELRRLMKFPPKDANVDVNASVSVNVVVELVVKGKFTHENVEELTGAFTRFGRVLSVLLDDERFGLNLPLRCCVSRGIC